MFFQHLGFAVDDEDERTTHVADVERFVVLIKDKDGAVHPADTLDDLRVAAGDLRTRYRSQPKACFRS